LRSVGEDCTTDIFLVELLVIPENEFLEVRGFELVFFHISSKDQQALSLNGRNGML
jgi:hypothetical protein